MHLQIVKNKDKAYLWKTYKKAIKPHIKKIWGWDLSWQKCDFEKSLVNYTSKLITVDGKIIGYIQYKVEAKESYINMLIIEPEFQSKGFGVAIINLIATQNKSSTVVLKCFKVNSRAYQFYLNQGFKVIDEDDNFYLLKRSNND